MRLQIVLDLHARFFFPRSVPPAERGDRAKQELIRAIKPYTLLRYARLSALYDAARALSEGGPEGARAECGVWNGGSAGLMTRASGNRSVWLFDS